MTTYDFSTLYTTLPHDILIKRLSNIILFLKVEIEHVLFPKIM